MDERVAPRNAEEGEASGLTTLLLRRLAGDFAGRALDLLGGHGTLGRDAGTTEGSVYALVDMAGNNPDEPLAAAMVIGPDASGEAEVRAIGVAVGYRGRGLGGRILAAVVDLLRTNGARRVSASPGPSVDAERLYRTAGFRPVVGAADPLESRYELEL